MIVKHNKLVRDNIPYIIQKSNKMSKTRVLNDEEFLYYLKEKLIEEAKEVKSSKNREELMAEIADILEVIEALLKTSQIKKEQIIEKKENKALKNGKFNKKIFLEYVEDNYE